LRGGYNFHADEMKLCAGAGVFATIGYLEGTLDYAFTDGGSLGSVNRLSMGLRF
jgi:hypothetical protein